MNKIDPQSWKADMPDFREKTKAFYNGEMSKGDYKGYSGRYGSYAQKGGKASMLRLRMTAGRVTKEKLAFIAESIRKYNVKKAHFTTCETIQLHDLQQEELCQIMEDALDVGIVTMGGGGDFPRNVMCSPLSGVEADEYFDVRPWAEAAGEYLMTFINAEKMPRKLKVCFSNSPKNIPHATYRDLGFVATKEGKFDVYSAGGLGNNYKMGVKVAENVKPEEVLYYVEAMVRTFTTYGNYESRAKSRTRYMQETLGVEGYKKAYQEKLLEVKAEFKDSLLIKESSVSAEQESNTEESVVNIKEQESQLKNVAAYPQTESASERVITQKQAGLYAVAYHPVGGMVPAQKFEEIYEGIKNAAKAEVRVAPDETLYIINLNAQQAEKIHKITADGAKNLFETSVSCIGSTVCQIGLRDSQGLLASIVEAVEPYHFADGVLPRIHISGCPSSCGTHQIGKLGFRGASKSVNGKAEPAFAFYVNGQDTQGEERFGEEWGVMLATDIPKFFVELGTVISDEKVSYEQWYKKNMDTLKNIVEPYLQK